MLRRFCYECGKLIPAERRKAMPRAVLCVRCADGQVKPRTEADVEVAKSDTADIVSMAQMPRSERD